MASNKTLKKKWLREIVRWRPGFAGLIERRRVPIVARLARKGYSARVIGRVCGVSKGTIQGLAWRNDKSIKLRGGRGKHPELNRQLRALPYYPNRYKK